MAADEKGSSGIVVEEVQKRFGLANGQSIEAV